MTQLIRKRVYIEKTLPKVTWTHGAHGGSTEFEFIPEEHLPKRLARRFRYIMIVSAHIALDFGSRARADSVHLLDHSVSGLDFYNDAASDNYCSFSGYELTSLLHFPPKIMFKSIDLDSEKQESFKFWAISYHRIEVKMKLRMVVFASQVPFDAFDFTSSPIPPEDVVDE